MVVYVGMVGFFNVGKFLLFWVILNVRFVVVFYLFIILKFYVGIVYYEGY